MKKFGLIVATLAMGLALGSVAFAQQDEQQAPPAGAPPAGWQGHGGKPMNPEHQLRHLTRELNLNSDQQAQVKQILTARDAQLAQLRQNGAIAPKEKHEQVRSVLADSDAKLRATLNPEQQQKFDAMRAEQKQKLEERRGGMATPNPEQPAMQQ